MANAKPEFSGVSIADGQRFFSLLRNTADLLLVLDENDLVVGVAQPDVHNVALPASWIGKQFKDLVSPESQSKLDGLFARDAATAGSHARWRHINLIDDSAGSIPLLLKFASLTGQLENGRFLLGRDLRPTIEMQTQFRLSHRELEAQIEALGHPHGTIWKGGNGSGHHTLSAAGNMGSAIVESAIGRVGQQPLGEIVTETSRTLERLCVTEALARVQGSHEAAAKLLGISLEDLHLTMMN